MAVYGYTRVSTQEQVEGNSLEAQRRRVKAAADFIGLEIEMLLVDAGISGAVPLDDRPHGSILVNSIEEGDTIIASKLDRMFRSAADALTWLEKLREANVKLILCDMGMDPVTENGVSKLLFSILAAMAEFERERIQERMAEGRKVKKESGGWTGGKPPFGFMIEGSGKNARCVPDPAFVEVVDSLKRCWIAGTSLRGASQYVHSKHGARVSFNQVGRVYAKFDHDSAEETKRADEIRAGSNVPVEESLSG